MKFNEIIFFQKTKLQNKITFGLTFVSLISPYIFTNVRFFFEYKNDKRLLLKQSYILLTWFYYLNFATTQKFKKYCKFFIFPIKHKHYTLLRAPMIHKNWSKEQIKFQYFYIRVTFSSNFSDNFTIENTNASLLFVMLSKKNFPILETNLLFLKSYLIIFFFHDSIFFNYNRFLK